MRLDRRAEAQLDAERPQVRRPTASIHASLVGASSTRSALPPARERSSSSWSRISPPVRALISLAACRDERPRQPVREEALERRASAGRRRTNSHQLSRSHCADPPLVAARQQREQPLDEATLGPRAGTPELRRGLEREPRPARARSASDSGAVRRRDELVRRRRPGRTGSARRRPDGRAPCAPPDGIRAIVSGRWR